MLSLGFVTDWAQTFLIKPNHHELGQIFGVEICDFDTALIYAKKLVEMGAENVLVSMNKLREVVDTLETKVDEKSWPMPTYIDLLFGIK